MTDSAGAASATYTYDEYGVPGAGNGGARMSYTGQMWLASLGLYHYKARAYNPATGRFMQPDPIGYGDGMNIYNYAGGDPVNFVDPFGLCSALPVYGGDNASVTFTYTGCGGGGGGGLTVASPAGTRSEKEADGTRERRKRRKGKENKQECPSGNAVTFLRGTRDAGIFFIDRGVDITLIGGVGALGGLAVGGPPGAAPGLVTMGYGGQVYAFGGSVAFVSGLGLGALGDMRSGAIAILDVFGGRILKRIPETIAPGLNSAVSEAQNGFIDVLDSLDGKQDDFPVCPD